MIWNFFVICLALASARDIEHVKPEFLDELRAAGEHEKFAKYLGVDEKLVSPDSSEQRSEGSRYNHVSVLGDILLTEEQERTGLNFNRYGGSRWPNGNVPYYISNDFSQDQANYIIRAINAFNARTSRVKLVRYSGQKDYCYITSGSGCWSYMGKVGGQQALSLQKDGCLSVGTIQHEFLHALGVTHEQNRPDRDNHVTVLWSNIPESWHSQYQKVNEEEYRQIGQYEHYSVMHYPIWSPETYKDAFQIPRGIDRNRLGQSDGVTDTDVYKIDTLYS